MTKQEKVFDILNKFEFFQGQRAGRELWNDKPKEVQDKDIADFIKDINYIRSYLQDSVVLSREEYEKLKMLEEGHITCEDMLEFVEKARKETAEKILQPLYNACEEDTYGQVVVDFAILENLAKQFGLEIKE